MIVRKKCTRCTQLKLMSDFTINSESPDGKTRICTSCLGEIEYEEYNNKINHKPLTIKKMATLAEKRKAAEEAAKKAGTPAPKVAPEKETPDPKKVGEATADGHTVVGEKKEPGQRGRKAAPERPIEQLDLETGTIVIAVHQTLQEAADAVGTTKAYVKDALSGWTKSAGKHKWRYEGEEIFVRPKKESVAKAEKTFKPEDKPVPGDLDYDPDTAEEELAPEEEESLDSIYEGEGSEEEVSPEE